MDIYNSVGGYPYPLKAVTAKKSVIYDNSGDSYPYPLKAIKSKQSVTYLQLPKTFAAQSSKSCPEQVWYKKTSSVQPVQPLEAAIWRGDLTEIKRLNSMGSKVKDLGERALDLAMDSKKDAVLEFLLQEGCLVSQRFKDHGFFRFSKKMRKTLIKAGCNDAGMCALLKKEGKEAQVTAIIADVNELAAACDTDIQKAQADIKVIEDSVERKIKNIRSVADMQVRNVREVADVGIKAEREKITAKAEQIVMAFQKA